MSHRIIKCKTGNATVSRWRIPAIPIMPRSGLYLTPSSHSDDLRFARIFKAAWKSIPLADRRMLLNHWRTDPIRNAFWGGPTVNIAETLDWIAPDSPDVMGLCRKRGHELWFRGPVTRMMPDLVLGELIAHELAHACQYTRIPPGQDPYWDDTEWELEAWEIERHWGFDPDAASAWCEANLQHALDFGDSGDMNAPQRRVTR